MTARASWPSHCVFVVSTTEIRFGEDDTTRVGRFEVQGWLLRVRAKSRA
jgi:hypothetical protein